MLRMRRYTLQNLGYRYHRVVVLMRGTLAEVVAYTNEQCGLEDTVETPSGDEAIPLMYADEDLRSSLAEEPADKPEPIDARKGWW